MADPAVGRTLVLIAMVQTGTGAVPGPQPLGTLLDAGGCPLAQFKSLSPQELRANLLPSLCPDLTHRPRLFPRTWDLRQLQVRGQCGSALEAELALTLKVLGTVADGSQGDILDQPLHTLRHMHSELQVSAQSEAGPQPQGRLYHRVQCLHEAPKKKESLAPQAWTCCPCLFPRPRELRQLQSLSCLEASVMFNLFYLLIRDLKGVTSEDPCV
ncbi:interferon lambda-3-like [Panthera onca]|uniref:interferon lambda-3-like n=1 Tax=Panthera onca TaxID=9690 RepID=UPI002954761B|nr:interferon lambda-3-like [Panthera onca]